MQFPPPFATIEEACEHIKAEHPDHGYLTNRLSLEKKAADTKLINLNHLHDMLHLKMEAAAQNKNVHAISTSR